MVQVTLTAPWGADCDNDQKFPSDGSDYIGGSVGSGPLRTANKFDISSIPADATITVVQLRVNVSGTAGTLSSTVWDIDGYNGTGLGNPETDAAATMFTSCAIAGVYVNDTTTFRTTGVKTIDLGVTAVADLQAARAAGAIYTVVIRETTDVATDVRAELSEYDDANTALRPALIVDYNVAPTLKIFISRPA